MHDGRREPGLHTLVQEHRVEDLSGGRRQSERHVRHPQRRLHRGVPALDLADGLDRLDGVAPGFVLTSGDGEREGVDDDVGGVHPPVVDQVGDQPLGDADLPLRGARLALFIDGQRDDGSPVLLDDRHDLLESGAGTVTVLVIDRVDQGSATQHLQAGLDDLRLGRVQHQRQRRGGSQQPRHLPHVLGSVASDVVDAEVQGVGSVGDLGPGDLDAVVPAGLEHRLAECLGPVGVRALADGQERGVLVERH